MLEIPENAENVWKPEKQEHRYVFGDLEKDKALLSNAEAKGPILYNPLGGIDIGTQFSVSSGIVDVVSQTFEPFGDMNTALDFEKIPNHESMSKYYDRGQHLDTMIEDYGALGAVALNRIAQQIGGQITGIYKFDLQEGKPKFNQGENVVVEFKHEGETKRFWYITNKFSCDSSVDYVPNEFDAFVQNLDFNTMLIKGAYSFWGYGPHPDAIFSAMLDPARKLNATVITDSNDESSFAIDMTCRPIWTPDYGPNKVDGRFGYGGVVFWGEGKYLIEKNDPSLDIPLWKRKDIDKRTKDPEFQKMMKSISASVDKAEKEARQS